MKTLFILGAGASQKAGAPLMANFLDRASDLLRVKTPGVIEAKTQFEDVFNAISELQGIHSKSFLDLDNIEIVFGAIEMGVLLKKLGKRDEASISKLRDSLITLIYKTLEYSIRFPVRGAKIFPPKPYDGFMTTLSGIEKNQSLNDPHKLSFLTFNYDLCLDFALHWFSKPFDYCLEAGQLPNGSPLLKLHGSINWGLGEDDKIIPYHIREVRFEHPLDSDGLFYSLGSSLNRTNSDGKVISKGPPVIVPPTWNKNSYHRQLSNVWSTAASEFLRRHKTFLS